MKKTSQHIAFTIALAAVVVAFAAAGLKGPVSRDTQAGPVEGGTRTREAPFRFTLSDHAAGDPAEALRSISKVPAGERLPLEMRLAGEWGRRDFAAARDWVLGSDPASRSDLLGALGRAGITSRPDEAMALADELANPQERISFYTTMVQAWAARNPDAAAGWVERCEPSEKGSIQTALVTELAQEDPQQAATYVAVNMEPGSAQDQAALTVAARWATLDPQAANTWARSLPESDLQQRVLAAVASLSAP